MFDIQINNINLIEAEFSMDLWLKLLPSILSLLGAVLAIILYNKYFYILSNLTETNLGRKIYRLF